jgi:hypothetical protein
MDVIVRFWLFLIGFCIIGVIGMEACMRQRGGLDETTGQPNLIGRCCVLPIVAAISYGLAYAIALRGEGKPLPHLRTCRKCGKQFSIKASSCPHCAIAARRSQDPEGG